MSAGLPLPEVPWGPHLAAYFIFIGLATGLALSLFVRPDDAEAADAFETFASAGALLALAVCGVILIVDLGQPWRFFFMLTRFNTHSVMAWGAKLIALKSALLALYLYLLQRRRAERLRGAAQLEDGATRALYAAVPWLIGLASVALTVYPTVLLARTWLAPLVGIPGGGLLFPGTTLVMGGAGAALIVLFAPGTGDPAFRARIERTLFFLLATEGVLLLFAWVGGSGMGAHVALLLQTLGEGRAAGLFWGAVVIAGLALPLVLLRLAPGKKATLALSAAASLLGASVIRYLLFVIR